MTKVSYIVGGLNYTSYQVAQEVANRTGQKLTRHYEKVEEKTPVDTELRAKRMKAFGIK